MQYEEFENTVLSYLKKDNKKCIKTINENEKLVNNYLRNDETHIKGFVNKLNELILEDLKSFKLTEKVLKHPLFVDVLEAFRNSDILVLSCFYMQTKAIKWLFTMDMNLRAQDERGRTALMCAAQRPSLTSTLEYLLKKDEGSAYLTDNNGNTALLYALKDEKHYKMLREKTHLDVQHINNNGENLLISCCKNKFLNNLSEVVSLTKDVNHESNEGKTAAMYLVMNGNHEELKYLYQHGLDVHHKNRQNETLVTVLIDQFKEMYSTLKGINDVHKYVQILIELVEWGCDFNIPIDEDGNTPIMFFLSSNDLYSADYILEKCSNLDLSRTNKYGINATYLTLFSDRNEDHLQQLFFDHPTFKLNFVDPLNQNCNLLMHYLVRKDKEYVSEILKRLPVPEKALCHKNDKGETPLIVAAKIGGVTENLIIPENINSQDALGNTALFYAIKVRDLEAVNLLAYSKADPNIKNAQGVSPFDLSLQMENKDKIIELIKNPMSPSQFSSINGKKKNKDEKLEDYIVEYQNNNYLKEYYTLLEKKGCSYGPSVNEEVKDQRLLYAYLTHSKLRTLKKLKGTYVDQRMLAYILSGSYRPLGV